MAPLGNLVRLHPLHINELPAHPALDSLITTPSEHPKSAGSSPSQAGKMDSSERPNLISFMEEILGQTSPPMNFHVRADREPRDHVSVLPCSPRKDNADLEKYNRPGYHLRG